MRLAILSSLVLLGLTSCGDDQSAAVLLCDRDAYDGAVRIEASDSNGEVAMEGVLHIDRAAGIITFERADGAFMVISPEGMKIGLRGMEQPPQEKDFPAFALLHNAAIAKPEGRSKVSYQEDGYTVQMGDQVMRVVLSGVGESKPR